MGTNNDPDRTAPLLDEEDLDRLLAKTRDEMLAQVRRQISDHDLKERLAQLLHRALAQEIREPDPSGDASGQAGDSRGAEPRPRMIIRHAKPLLGVLACLADADIPQFLLDPSLLARSAHPDLFDADVLPQLLETLTEFRLIKTAGCAGAGSGHPPPVLRLAPAARYKARHQPDFAARHGTYLTTAASLLRLATERDPEHPANWPVFEFLAPHCGFLLRSVSEGLVPELPADAVDLIASSAFEAGRYLYARGFLEEAQAEFGTVVQVRQQLTSGSTDATLRARGWHACALRDRGHLAAAEMELRAVNAGLKDQLARAADATGALARLAGMDWLTPEGLRLLDRDWDSSSARLLLAVIENHLDLSVVHAYRGASYEDNPDKQEKAARQAQVTAYEAARRVAGEEHPHTLAGRCGIAIRTYKEGTLTARRDLLELAEQEFRAVYEIQRRLPELGDGHPYTQVTLSWLGSALEALGRLDEAEVVYRESCRFHQRTLGDHFLTLWIRSSIVDVLYRRGDRDAAEEEERAVLAAWRRLAAAEASAPQDRLPTLSIRDGLAWALVARGRRRLTAPSQSKDKKYGSTVRSSETKQDASIDRPSIEAILSDTMTPPRTCSQHNAVSPVLPGSTAPALASSQLAL